MNLNSRLSILLSGILVASSVNAAPNSWLPTNPTVQLQNGTVVGVHNPEFNQDFFLGIPFAQPPIGDLRFAKPAPPVAWSGIKTATEYGPSCVGNSLGLAGFSQNTTSVMSEDCLHINIVRPAGISRHSKLPVLVWIYGGAWMDGSANEPRYNGSFLVQSSVQMNSPIIFVSFNYRLGIFGTLAGPVFEQAGLTNLLLHDQRQALAWVQDNIAQFGGDPSHVTLMGESAGAGSIGFQLLAHGGRDDGLFHAAIAESGGPFSVYAFRNSSQRQSDFDKVLDITDCANATDSLACLRKAPAESLKKASLQVQPYFTVDGDLIPDHNSRLLQNGQFLRVPLLIGINRNEGTSFLNTGLSGPFVTDEDFIKFVRGSIGDYEVPDSVMKLWLKEYQEEAESQSPAGLGTVLADPGPEYGPGYGRATLWIGDFLLGAGRRYANQVWAKHHVPSYSYFFDVAPASLNATTIGATHAQELPFVFGNSNATGWDLDPFPKDVDLREKYLDLVEVMSRMWISFAVNKTPNLHKGQ
ncbi:hypothetical protein CDV36_012144 [Fusarium kuroshium]|uniref:Carboxylic ester hydrolase n=1 Tax=Fusarium kuroshium TaxID=2010991 RepID=A0A3M2RSV3_9HYPO|nr:hypothetical protein CDV36_012144 [Fusarium kuroshium]